MAAFADLSTIRALDITDVDEFALRYSVCTFVTKPQQYQNLIQSMNTRGFGTEDCEFLYINNSISNKYDAFSGINKFLEVSRGKYIILCHQDVVLLFDGRNRLDDIIADLDRIDPKWGLFGNSGGISPGRLAIRISDPHGEDQHRESLPIRVNSLDENFIVVRKDAKSRIIARPPGVPYVRNRVMRHCEYFGADRLCCGFPFAAS